MRFLRSVLILSALCFLPQVASANDAPPPPGAPAAQQPPAPAPPPPQNPPPPGPHARREEEEKAGLYARLKAHLKGTGAMANDLSALQTENARLQARITELENGAELKALRDANTAMQADIQAFITFAQSHGLAHENGGKTPPPAPQSPMAKAAGAAVAGAVSTQLAGLGVPAAQLPPAAPQPGAQAATLVEVEEQLKACKTDRERQAILTKHRDLIIGSN